MGHWGAPRGLSGALSTLPVPEVLAQHVPPQGTPPSAASRSRGRRYRGEERSVGLGPGRRGAAACGTARSRGSAGQHRQGKGAAVSPFPPPQGLPRFAPAHPAPHLLYGLEGEGELAADGPGGGQDIQDIQEISILQGGRAAGQPGSAGQGPHSPQSPHSPCADPPGRRHTWGWRGAWGPRAGAGTEGRAVRGPVGLRWPWDQQGDVPAPPGPPVPAASPFCPAQHLADDRADGKQLLCGVAGLRERRIVVITGGHWFVLGL